MTAVAALACGPTVGSPEDGGADGGTTQAGDASSDGSLVTMTGQDPDTSASTSDSGVDSSGSSGTEELVELLPGESVITMGTCNEDGTMRVLIEGYFDQVFEDCAPPPDAPVDGVLLVGIEAWDQLPGVYEVTQDGSVRVALGTEAMTGTLELSIWAPGHPSVLTLDVAGDTTALRGTMELEQCTVLLDDCIPSG